VLFPNDTGPQRVPGLSIGVRRCAVAGWTVWVSPRAPAFPRYETYVRIVVDDPAAPLTGAEALITMRGRVD
jgi:hypothetical protein